MVEVVVGHGAAQGRTGLDREAVVESRQREILGCVAATVNKHLEAIYDRLDVHNRTAAAALHRG